MRLAGGHTHGRRRRPRIYPPANEQLAADWSTPLLIREIVTESPEKEKNKNSNNPKTKDKVKKRQLFETYCRSIMQEQRVSGRRMLCQSALKHLRHGGAPVTAVKKSGI